MYSYKPIIGWNGSAKPLICSVFSDSKEVFDTPQVFDFLKSILMRFYSPIDLTGNMNMIEKLVLGGTGIGDLSILSPTL